LPGRVLAVLRVGPRLHAVHHARPARVGIHRLVRRRGVTTVTAAPSERSPGLVLSWLGGTDHKRVATHLCSSCGVFLVLGGIAALTMRTELAQPGLQILSRNHYNELYSLHGSTMIYFVMTPAALSLGAYLVPLQIGAADLVAPRLNLFAMWLQV